MVTCFSEYIVIGLGPPSQNLSGTLSPSIHNLTNLEIVLLQNNRITGPILAEIGKLEKLQTIDLSDNQFTDEIPTSLSQLTSLQYIIVGNPLICKTGSEQECHGMTLMPMSITLKTTPDMHHEEVSSGNLRKFQFRELQIATHNFSNKNILSKGGFGHVYKGQLQDGTCVAVKRLKDGGAAGGERQFQMEVEMISLAVHRNLLKLYRFCMTSNRKAIGLSLHVQWWCRFPSQKYHLYYIIITLDQNQTSGPTTGPKRVISIFIIFFLFTVDKHKLSFLNMPKNF